MLSKEKIEYHRFQVDENATKEQNVLRAIWTKNM